MIVRNRWVVALVVGLGVALVTGCSGGSGGGGGNTGNIDNTSPDMTRVRLVEGGYDQWLVPVRIGNQVLNLLLDTGAKSLLVFDDKINADNTDVQRTDESVLMYFGSGARSGHVGLAPVTIGRYTADEMRIMLIESPTSSTDTSLSAKRADGILGTRFQPSFESTVGAPLDIPLLTLQPAIRTLEFDLNANGASYLTIGGQPTIESSAASFLFTAYTTTELGPDRVTESYADLEVPFTVSTSAGAADDDNLDILLDTGAVSRLLLDRRVAAQIGYDTDLREWTVPNSTPVDLRFIGFGSQNLQVEPAFTVGDVRVIDLSTTTFDAVLGLDRWQNYVVGFSFLDFTLGGPEGTMQFLKRDDLGAAQQGCPALTSNYVALPGLNSAANEYCGGMSSDGRYLPFMSDRAGGRGLRDIYVYEVGVGLLDVSGANSAYNDDNPSISTDGRYLCFNSCRENGHDDVYVYDIPSQTFVDLPGLNTDGLERTPVISPDGRYISFRSERGGGDSPSDIYLYDRQTESLVDLPGLNTTADELASSPNEGATLIAFDAYNRAGGKGTFDQFVYDRTAGRVIDLSNDLNTAYYDGRGVLSGNGRYLIYLTDGEGDQPGEQDRDMVLVDLQQNGSDGKPGRRITPRDLNSEAGEGAATLSANGKLIAFESRRCGGAGGYDIYLYRIAD